MEYPDYSNPNEDNLSLGSHEGNKRNLLDDAKSYDKGYTKIYRNVVSDNGRIKRKKIVVYTSGGVGSNIRDAETGEYYSYKVCSLDEELFFKVTLPTGDCSRGNNLGSNTLFYSSPEQYMAHQMIDYDDISDEIIDKWKIKKNMRARIVEERKKPKLAVIVK